MVVVASTGPSGRMAEHRFDPGDPGARWRMCRSQTLSPADGSRSATGLDEFAQRSDQCLAETEMDDAAIGLELGSVPNQIPDSVAQVHHREGNP